MGEQKKLQPDSEYNALDLDNDGVVSDNELAVMEALEQKEKMEAQLCCCTWFAPRSRAHTKADYHHQFHGHNVLYYRVLPQSTKVLGLLKSLLQDGYGALLKHPQ